MDDGRISQRLGALVVVAVLALVYPFLSAVGGVSFAFGIPVFYLYLFLTWSVFIAVVGAAMWWEWHAGKRRDRRP